MHSKVLSQAIIQCVAAYVIAVGVDGLKQAHLIQTREVVEILYFVCVAVIPILIGAVAFSCAESIADKALVGHDSHTPKHDATLAARALQIAAAFLIAGCVPALFSIANYVYGIIHRPIGGTIPAATVMLRNALVIGVVIQVGLSIIVLRHAHKLLVVARLSRQTN